MATIRRNPKGAPPPLPPSPPKPPGFYSYNKIGPEHYGYNKLVIATPMPANITPVKPLEPNTELWSTTCKRCGEIIEDGGVCNCPSGIKRLIIWLKTILKSW